MKYRFIPVLLLACLALSPAGAAAGTTAAAAAKPKLAAHVATGVRVDVVPSARSPEQWAAERPHYQDLRPRIRGTSD